MRWTQGGALAQQDLELGHLALHRLAQRVQPARFGVVDARPSQLRIKLMQLQLQPFDVSTHRAQRVLAPAARLVEVVLSLVQLIDPLIVDVRNLHQRRRMLRIRHELVTERLSHAIAV